MNIIFIFDGLQFGGIERVGVEYIKLLSSRNYHITVVNLKPKLNALEKEIPDNIDVIHLHYPRSLSSYRYGKLRRLGIMGNIVYRMIFVVLSIINLLYKPFYLNKIRGVYESDVAIAFSGHINDLAFTAYNFKPHVGKTIAWLHGSQYSYNVINPGFYDLYVKIGNLVCLSEKDDEKGVFSFNEKNRINKVKIYNPINLGDRVIDSNKVESLKVKYGDYILMVGRLSKDKDQACLINAVRILSEKYNLKKNLLLVGDGPELDKLKKAAQDFGVSDQVFFIGARYDVQNYYAAACIYAHSSPAEGLPTVLLEAMFYHLPVVSTNSEPGVEEILQDKYGLISPVGDSEALADNIYSVYTDQGLRNTLVSQEPERLKSFMPGHVIEQFENMIMQ